MSLPLAIFLMGPTASGKTAATEALIDKFPVEIISVDSALVYRGMDIGTAKPDSDFLRRVPHHLIDICDPTETYSAGRFRDDALRLMGEITARGKIPLLVGGTMLYFRALQRLDDLPDANPAVRERLQQQLKEGGLSAMHARLTRVDPVSAERLHPNDSQRVLRALELFELTGQPMAALQNNAKPLPYRVLKLALLPEDRAQIHRRIAQRLDQMFDDGFLMEVERLHLREDLSPQLPSIRAVGYRQVWQHLDGEIPLDEAKARCLYATRQLAKRQITWLRKEPELNKIDPLLPGWAETIDSAVDKFLQAAL